jgi:hypothetical protein
MEYPWKRFWSLRSSRLVLEPSGFLVDPDGTYGKVLNPEVKHFSEIDATPCLVLLGEPGIGKSTADTAGNTQYGPRSPSARGS